MLQKNSTIIRFIVLAIIVLLRPFPCLSGGIKGDRELLKTVAQKHKANFESILTWKGEAFEERRSTKKVDNYSYMLKSKITFVYDRSRYASRWNREPQEFHAEVNGESFSGTFAKYNSAMITRKAACTYRKSGTDQYGNDTFRVIVYEPRDGVRKIGNQGFDPRYFFNNAGRYDLYEHLMLLYENADNPKLTERHVKRQGDHVIMTLEKVVEDGIRTEKQVYDLSAGGNMVEFYNSGPTCENHREYEYEEKSGVWIMKSYKRLNITHHEDGILRSTRTVRWSNSVVNVPFEEDEFTLAKLGLRPGDLIQANQIGVMYEYGVDDVNLDMLVPDNMHDEVKVRGVSEKPDEVNPAAQKEDANEVDSAADGKILLTSEAKHDEKGARTYFYVIIVAIVISLAAVAYKLLRSGTLKKSDQ
jgi:hypothetical protein